jgi:hypothetical protein
MHLPAPPPQPGGRAADSWGPLRTEGRTYRRQAQEAQALLLLQALHRSETGGPPPHTDHLPHLLSPRLLVGQAEPGGRADTARQVLPVSVESVLRPRPS